MMTNIVTEPKYSRYEKTEMTGQGNFSLVNDDGLASTAKPKSLSIGQNVPSPGY